MSGFILFLFVVFFVFPFIAKNARSRKTKTHKAKTQWGQTHDQITKPEQSRFGHSDAKARLRQRLRNRDGSTVFPENYKVREQERSRQDAIENRVMEAVMHGKKNRGIIKVGNKGRDDWGARGDGGSVVGLIALSVIIATTYFVWTAFLS